jgi:PAS domain S-box-containing protein
LFVGLTPDGTLTFVNEAYADYLGLAKDDPLRLGPETGVAWDTHIELVHPDDREETLRVGATCNRTGAAGQAAFRIRNSEGEYRWFRSRLEPLRASDGTLLYWIGINLDIKELKRAEEQRRIAEEKIREQEMELRHILDLTPQLIAVFGPRGATLIIGRYGQATNFRRSSLRLTANKEKTCDPRRNRIFDVAEGHHER